MKLNRSSRDVTKLARSISCVMFLFVLESSSFPTKTAPGNATESIVPRSLYIPETQDTPLYNISQPSSERQQSDLTDQITSQFDFQSVNLALNQEWIKCDVFHYGLTKFTIEEFEAAGIDSDYRALIGFMADQQSSHATDLTKLLGPMAAKPCQYQYPFTNVREFIHFCQKLTRWGESSVYGFLPFLEHSDSVQILLQSITTEAREQMMFQKYEGLLPTPTYRIPSIPQSWAWTLLHPYLISCPTTNPRIEFDIYPTLRILNRADTTLDPESPAMSHNRTPLSESGPVVSFEFDLPGLTVRPDSEYRTITHSVSGLPKFAAWTSQYHVTYSKLFNITNTSASTIQPFSQSVSGGVDSTSTIGTVFIVLTDVDFFVKPSNMTFLNPHIVSGPAIYQINRST